MSGKRDEVSNDEASVLVSLDYELNEHDRYLLALVSADQRQKMFARLAALSEVRRKTLGVGDASAKAGVSLPTFYRLVAGWDDPEKRGLHLVAGIAGRRPRGIVKDDTRKAAKAAAQKLLNAAPLADLPVKTVARLIRKATGEGVSLDVAENVVREVRMERPVEKSESNGRYGRDLLIDCSAVSMKMLDPGDARAGLVILATVIETSTGLLLAAVPAREHDAVKAQAQAVADAIEGLQTYNVDIAHDEPTRVRAVVGPSTDPLFKDLVRILEANIGSENVRAVGPRRFGRFTIAIIGRTLGRLRFLPASTQGGSIDAAGARSAGHRSMDARQTRFIIKQSVKEHNAPILERIRKQRKEGVIKGERPDRGRMTQALGLALPLKGSVFETFIIE